jgi:hypothetical protein
VPTDNSNDQVKPDHHKDADISNLKGALKNIKDKKNQ